MKVERYNRVIETGVTAVQIGSENMLEVARKWGGTVHYPRGGEGVFEIYAARMGDQGKRQGWSMREGEWLVCPDGDDLKNNLEIWPDAEFRQAFNRAP